MSTIGDITSIARLILDVVKAVREYSGGKPEKGKLFNPEIIADLHGYSIRLKKSTKELKKAIQEADDIKKENATKEFYHNLLHFSERLQALNLNLIDIYQPGTGAALAAACGLDSIVFSYFERSFSDYDIPKRKIKRQHGNLMALNDEFEKLDLLFVDKAIAKVSSDQELLNTLLTLSNGLEQCANLLAGFLRENWSPSDLTEKS
jgi:hypothetical protein